MYRVRWILALAAATAGVAAPACGNDSWRRVLALPPEPEAADNAWNRWRPSIDAVMSWQAPDVQALEHGDDAALRAIAARHAEAVAVSGLDEGERVSLPRPQGSEGAVEHGAALRRLAALRGAAVREAWRAGERARAVALAAGLVRAGAEVADDACSVAGYLAGLAVVDAGADCAAWLARQDGAAEVDRSGLDAALAQAADAVSTGLEHALAGEFHLVFRVVVERIPATRDPGLLLDRVGMLGLAPEGAPRGLEGRLAPVADGVVLLDVEETLALYARALATFIEETRRDGGRWRPGRFGGPWREQVQRWMVELGPLAQQAFHGDADAIDDATRAAIDAWLPQVDNPFGKLLLILLATDVDALAGSAARAAARVRHARAVVDEAKGAATHGPG